MGSFVRQVRWAALGAIMMTAACNGSGLSPAERAEVANIADEALADALAGDEQVSDLTGRVEVLEKRLGPQDASHSPLGLTGRLDRLEERMGTVQSAQSEEQWRQTFSR